MNNSIEDFSDDDESKEEEPSTSDRIYSLHSVESEISNLNEEFSKLDYEYPIRITEKPLEFIQREREPTDDDTQIYHLGHHKLFTDLSIKLGSSNLPRFSCACHKLNIVIHSAMNNQEELADILKKLNTFATSIRKSINLSQIFSNAKIRPKVETKTRWFSQLYVLLWAKKTYDRNGIKNKFFFF